MKKVIENSKEKAETFTQPGTIWASSINPKLPEELDSNFDKEEEQLQNKWANLMGDIGIGIHMLRSSALRDSVREGIPSASRGRMWMILSGASHYMSTCPVDYFEKILAKAKSQTESPFSKLIEKDLTRSFPSHPFYQEGEGVELLRDVLLAYSVHNPAIGYCQSMNILCSIFLLFLPPNQAFFLLCAVCEYLVPDYYIAGLIGSSVDQLLFQSIFYSKKKLF